MVLVLYSGDMELFCLGPGCRYTHWKQTVFYMKDQMTIKRGEIIKGSFKVTPNKRNKVKMFMEIFVYLEKYFNRLPFYDKICI